jgi:hypothetical protein
VIDTNCRRLIDGRSIDISPGVSIISSGAVISMRPFRSRFQQRFSPGLPQMTQGHKHRRKGRVISVTTKVIFGKEQEVKELLQASPVSKSVNISFVERNNLTLRQQSRRLGRKTNGFSKDISKLEAQLYLASGYYHFVKEHFGLR